jgi:hypothetical protein
MARSPDAVGPPKLHFQQEVRVVGATGLETDDGGEPVDAAAIVGDTLDVTDARPTVERDGWVIGASGEATDG